jgi:hypothetical protein
MVTYQEWWPNAFKLKQISLCEAHHKAYHVGELDREEI